jgi:hypothetical protein
MSLRFKLYWYDFIDFLADALWYGIYLAVALVCWHFFGFEPTAIAIGVLIFTHLKRN